MTIMTMSFSFSSSSFGRERGFQYRRSSSSSIFFVSPRRKQTLLMFFASSSSCWPKPIMRSTRFTPHTNTTTALSPSYCCPNSQHSLSADYNLISTTERSDGSFIFRFGNVGEIEEESVEVKITQKDADPEDTAVDALNIKELEESQLGGGGFASETALLCGEGSSNLKTEMGNRHVQATAPTTTVLEVFREDGEGEGLSQSGSSALHITAAEVPDRFVSSSSNEERTGLRTAHLSQGSHDDNVHNVANNTIDKDGDEAFTSSEAEVTLDEDSSHHIVAVPVDDDGIKPLKMLDGKLHSYGCSRGSAHVSMSFEVQLYESGATLNREGILTKGFFLSSGTALLPDPSKALTGGEDAYFVYQNWLGIADGVGQWSLGGIKPGEYAQELIENCEKIVSESKYIPLTDPVELLDKAAMGTQCVGLSTALVAYFDGQVLHVANIRDSGFLIIRNGTVCKRSSPMVHEFNFPLHMEKGDYPSKLTERYTIDLDEGDVIIAASNSLFDNLYEQEIGPMVSHSLQAGLRLQEIAKLLATRAQEVGRSATVRSPFADAAQAAGYVGYTGGRLDDVTVIVSLVQSRSASPLP